MSRFFEDAKPIKSVLAKSLASLREKNYAASKDKKRHYLTGREMLILGRLIYSWKEIVGSHLASKTCPKRLFKGRLYLTVSDSQWLQTLLFLKAEIIEKLNTRFPDIKIKEIIGNLGEIPTQIIEIIKEEQWPCWQDEDDISFPDHLDTELTSSIARCRKKSKARFKGLQKKGFYLCTSCNANTVASKDEPCAICLFNQNLEIFLKTKRLLNDMPWLSVDEVSEIEPGIKPGEVSAIKSVLFQEVCETIDELALLALSKDFEDEPAREKFFASLKSEITKAIVLDTGSLPHEINLNKLSKKQLADNRWLDYLKIEKEVVTC